MHARAAWDTYFGGVTADDRISWVATRASQGKQYCSKTRPGQAEGLGVHTFKVASGGWRC